MEVLLNDVCYEYRNKYRRVEAVKNVSYRFEEKLSAVGITEEMWKRLPHMLSGGEQQRVAIVRALESGSKIILADEPTGNLDSENGKNIVDILKRLAHEKGYCVVIVTHDPTVAAEADIVLKIFRFSVNVGKITMKSTVGEWIGIKHLFVLLDVS